MKFVRYVQACRKKMHVNRRQQVERIYKRCVALGMQPWRVGGRTDEDRLLLQRAVQAQKSTLSKAEKEAVHHLVNLFRGN